MTFGALGAALAAVVGAGLFFGSQDDDTIRPDTEQAIADAGYNASDRAAIEAIVRDYILEHPEIIPEAIENLQQRQQASALGPVREKLEKPFAGAAFAGNPNGEIVLIEFSDFACPYCRSTADDLKKLIADNADLKVVFHELPILSPQSDKAAKVALAAAKQGKYFAFYQAMFAAGRPSDQTIAEAARNAGLDVDKAMAYAASDEAEAEIAANKKMVRSLPFGQGFGTPAWVIGDRLEVGALGYEGLSKLVEEARAAAGK